MRNINPRIMVVSLMILIIFDNSVLNVAGLSDFKGVIKQ